MNNFYFYFSAVAAAVPREADQEACGGVWTRDEAWDGISYADTIPSSVLDYKFHEINLDNTNDDENSPRELTWAQLLSSEETIPSAAAARVGCDVPTRSRVSAELPELRHLNL